MLHPETRGSIVNWATGHGLASDDSSANLGYPLQSRTKGSNKVRLI